MEGNLELRYWQLLESYDVRNRPAVAHTKEKLLKHTFVPNVRRTVFSSATAPLLRPDAALCLLTLYDYMIIRPYAAKITSADYPVGIPSPHQDETSPDFRRKLEQSLDSIFGALPEKNRDEPHSSHEVLAAINFAWKTQAMLFGWG